MSIDLKINLNGKMADGKQQEIVENMSLRSDAVQEIISHKPGFKERWSLLLFLLVLSLIFASSWFIKYPEVIQANAVLTAANAPKEIVSLQEGKLERLFVANDEKVVQGQMIGWIESIANHQEVISLAGLLDQAEYYLAKNKSEKVSTLFNGPFYNLGELQISYQQFIIFWQQFNDYLVNGYYFKRKNALFEDYNFLKKLHKTLERQHELAQQDLQLTLEAFDANDSLYKDRVISKQDFRDQKSKLVSKQMSIPQLQSSILINEDQQISKRKEIDELEHDISKQKTIFQQALQTLKSLVDNWAKKYIIKAPVEGKVVFSIQLQENQFIQAGKTIGFINPFNSRYYAQVILPQGNFGKIDTGQKVQLRFDAYPYQEYGFVKGKLSYISKVSSDSGFLANIELPEGLMTNFRKEIQFKNGLKSRVLIITQNARLLQRFYSNLVVALHE